MINSRRELIDTARNLYIPLLERTAHRYRHKEQYVVSDAVGFECTLLEELFRPLWGIAPILNEENFYINIDGKKVLVSDYITQIICDGTDENSERRFDRNVTEFNKISFANQAITEVAAYLVTVYFSKELLWDSLSAETRDSIAKWILKWSVTAIKNSWPNNHYWYPVICIELLTRLGYDCGDVDSDLKKAYEVLDSLYVDNGWYMDGCFGRFDYYEAWAHHAYTLLWILIADKNQKGYAKRAETYKRRTEEFLKFYSRFFDSDGGMVAFGRSISYRFAAVSVFGLAAAVNCNIDMGLARNIILKNIDYFITKSIPTKDGIFPCGYLYETTSFTESYASDGANCCYTEGFMCLFAPKDHPLWTDKLSPMPIENKNYLTECPVEGLDIIIQGDNKTNGVTMYNNSIHYYQADFFTHKFNDMGGYYSKFAYNSRSGYGISTRDNISSDNMISLMSLDGTMTSHRKRINDLGIHDNVLISSHIPFANDKETTIKTYVIPLSEGYHVRIHKIHLSQSYIVREGGFSVGITDDNFNAEGNTVIYNDYISKIFVNATFASKYCTAAIHPGMHLLKPQAIYPCYCSEPLEKGDYTAVTTVGFSTNGKLNTPPEVNINNNKVTITLGDFKKTIIIDKE